MKKALAISGQYRTFGKTKNSIKQLIDANDLDVFFHLWSSDKSQEKEIVDFLNPKGYMVEDPGKYDQHFAEIENRIRTARNKGYGIDNLKKQISMNYSRYSVHNLIKEDYDVIIYTRFDVQVNHTFILNTVPTSIITPAAEAWGSISDIFAIIPHHLTQYYFLYPVLEKLHSTSFEKDFKQYIFEKYSQETLEIHDNQRYCPHVILLRNLFINKVPYVIENLSVHIQR
jgi:hypothetical protein